MQNWQIYQYLVPYFISLGITSSVAVYTWRRRSVQGALAYSWVALSQAVWTLGYIIELLSPTLQGKIFWDDFQWLGVIGWYVGILAFAYQFTETKFSNPKRTWILLMVLPVVLLLLVATNRLHGIIHANERLIPGEPFSALDYDFTTAVLAFAFYGYLLVLLSLFVLVRKYIRTQPIFRAQTGIIVVGTLIPLIGTMLTVMGIEISFHRDITPLTFAVSNLIVAYGLSRYRFLDIVPIAYKAVFDNLSDAVVVVDSQRRLVDYNPAAQKLLPQLSSKMIGMTTSEVFSDAPDIVKRFRGVEEIRTEMEIQRESNTLYQDVRISPLRSRSRGLLGRVIVVRDATEQKKAEKALRESEEKYRQLVETTPDWVWSIDYDGNHTFSNEAVKHVLGYSIDEVIGKSAFPFIHPDDQEKIRQMVIQAREGKHGWKNVRIRWIHKDGSIRFCESTAQPLLDAEGNLVGFSGIDREITARVLAEKAAEYYAEKLKAANKELKAFSYSVSHDLRAPLRAITGFTEILVDQYQGALDKEGQDYLQRVMDAGWHMGQLIEDLLRLSNVTSSDMKHQKVNLSRLAENITEDLRSSQPDRKVDFMIESDISAICDPGLMRVVLENLLGNAWKFSSREKLSKIIFGCEENKRERIFFVRDNGVGFDMAYADKLFVPFQRLHKSSEFEGSGIGLATVQRIIHRHGGKVWVEAEPDKGAIFYFTI
jgi:PAS domain S-box-containing protein